MDKFGYFGIDLLMIPFWVFLYWKAPAETKKTMIKHGFYGGVIAMATEHIFIKDYWVPPPITGIEGFYVPEDFLYGFLLIGITVTLYDLFFKVKKEQIYTKQRVLSYLFVVLILGSFFLFVQYYGLISTFVISAAMFVATLMMVIIRRDLLKKALISSVIVFVLSFVIHVILFYLFLPDWWHQYWHLVDKPYAFYILNTPWTEYMWYFAFGGFMSIISDFSHGRAVKPSV